MQRRSGGKPRSCRHRKIVRSSVKTTSYVWLACRQGTGRDCARTRRPGTELSRLEIWRFFDRFQSLSSVRKSDDAQVMLRGAHLKGGIQGLLAGRCARGRPFQ